MEKLKVYFDQNADIIRELFEKAKSGQLNAEEKRKDLELKIANVSNQEEQIMKDAISSAVKFEDEYKNSTEEKIERFKVESQKKLVNEKELGFKKIQETLIDSVIDKTKTNINCDNTKKNKVANNLFA